MRGWTWKTDAATSRNYAFTLLLLQLRRRVEDGPDSFIKDGLEIFLCQRGAFEILDGFNVLLHRQTLLICYRCHTSLAQLVDGVRIVTEIEFGTDE